jgi:predicted anti-sigma-YlaC factor YlaD
MTSSTLHHTDAARDCAAILDFAVDWVNGVLRGEALAQVEAHLERCPPCRAALASDATLRRRLRRIVPERAPDSLRTRIDALRRRSS